MSLLQITDYLLTTPQGNSLILFNQLSFNAQLLRCFFRFIELRIDFRKYFYKLFSWIFLFLFHFFFFFSVGESGCLKRRTCFLLLKKKEFQWKRILWKTMLVISLIESGTRCHYQSTYHLSARLFCEMYIFR